MSPENNFIPQQRKTKILEIIQIKGSAGVHELVRQVGASIATVRRDLEELENMGMVKRIRGGAMLTLSVRTTFEPEYRHASQVAAEKKHAIGRAAAGIIQRGQSVIFDSSSTVYQAAQQIIERGVDILAVTNDVFTAALLANTTGTKIQVLGGTLRPGSYTMLGEPGQEFLEGLHVELCLLGIQAIHLPSGDPTQFNASSGGLSDTSVEVSAMKRAMMRAARKTLVLADSGKFGQTAFCDVCSLKQIDGIITDDALDKRIRKELEDLGIEVIIA